MPWFTKERKKKASLGFSGHIQGRFRPISVVSGVFRPFLACFSRIGRRLIWPDMADTAQLWLNQPGSARIEADSAQIELRWCESSRVGMNPRKKKKKHRRGSTHGQPRRTPRPASDAGAAPLMLRPCFLGLLQSQEPSWDTLIHRKVIWDCTKVTQIHRSNICK